MATVTDKCDPKRPAGALALPVSRIPEPLRPLYCVLAHLSQHVRGDAQHALARLAVYANWPSGVVEVGHRRLLADSGMPDHALRAALAELDESGWAPVEGRGAHGVYRRRIRLCDGCQRGNSSHAGAWFSVAMSYTLEPGRENGQRGNRCHETEELQVVPTGTPVIPDNRPTTHPPNGDGRPGAVPPAPEHPSRLGGKPPSRLHNPSNPQGAITQHPPAARRPTITNAAPTVDPGADVHHGATATQATAGAIVPFKARSSDAGTHGGAACAQSRDPPGDTPGDPVLHPTDGRLFEMEPAPKREHWR